MGIVEIFTRFTKLIISAIPTLIKANAAARDEIIDIVSDLAAELQDGLNLTAAYLRGIKSIDDPDELRKQVQHAESALFRYHSEFRICRGLRKLRDRFKRIFDQLPAAISVEHKEEVERLLLEMESDERLIIDELQEVWTELHQATSSNDPIIRTRSMIDCQLTAIVERRKIIAKKAKEIIASI